MTVTRHGDGRVLYGCLDFYDGAELTWEMVGRPDIAAIAGHVISTPAGPYLVPLKPPQPGIRYTDGRCYGGIER